MSLFDGKPAPSQVDLFAPPDPNSAAAQFDADFARRALDELFEATQRYRTGPELAELLRFMMRFHFYAPFNAMLLHIQNPGTTYALPTSRWLRDYDRVIKPGARPLVILQPMGPVMFVFDVSETEAASSATPPLPKEVTDPFRSEGEVKNKIYRRLVHNAIRDGVSVFEPPAGSKSAGEIMVTRVSGQTLEFSKKISVPRRYDVVLNTNHSETTRFTTLVHELAHLYCGHLGIPFEGCDWWPNRTGLSHGAREFEAESVAYLVCGRLGVKTPSDRYLSGYLENGKQAPNISLERVLVAAGLIESMCDKSLPPNRSPKRDHDG